MSESCSLSIDHLPPQSTEHAKMTHATHMAHIGLANAPYVTLLNVLSPLLYEKDPNIIVNIIERAIIHKITANVCKNIPRCS